MAALFNQDVQVTNLDIKDARQKETSALHALCLRSWPTVRTASLDLAASDSSDDNFSQQLSFTIMLIST